MPDQLTTARDQIAEMCGWVRIDYFDDPPGVVRTTWGHELSDSLDRHPIPDSLDFVSRVWLDERYLFPDMRESVNHEDRVLSAFIHLLDILKSMRRVNRPAFDAACEKVRKEIQG